MRLKAWLAFLDESGFSQRPPIRATWAPKGHTPIVCEPFNWKRLSGIGAVLTTPNAKRLRWFLAVHPGGIKSPQVVRFLNALSRHRRKPVILLWDRLPAHRSGPVQQALRTHRRWLKIEWLPAYAPELNPIEPLWDYLDDTKLVNTPIDDLSRLRQRVHAALHKVRCDNSIGRGFLRYSGLF